MAEIQVKINGPDPYLGPRLAVGAAVFILYFVHYVILIFQAKGSAEVKEYVVKRIYLYSLAALLSITFIQGSTFCAVLAWFTLIPFILLHFTSFRDSFQGLQDKKDALWLAFYFFLFIWYFGLIIQFYILPDPLT